MMHSQKNIKLTHNFNLQKYLISWRVYNSRRERHDFVFLADCLWLSNFRNMHACVPTHAHAHTRTHTHTLTYPPAYMPHDIQYCWSAPLHVQYSSLPCTLQHSGHYRQTLTESWTRLTISIPHWNTITALGTWWMFNGPSYIFHMTQLQTLYSFMLTYRNNITTVCLFIHAWPLLEVRIISWICFAEWFSLPQHLSRFTKINATLKTYKYNNIILQMHTSTTPKQVQDVSI